MNKNFQELYQNVVMDHTKNPRNFFPLNDAIVGEGENPMCGDSFQIFLKLDNQLITEASFQGAGCAISKSSASILTESVVGKSVEEIRALAKTFGQMINGEELTTEACEKLGELIAFAEIANFPTRVKCAWLAWSALEKAIERVES